MPRLMTGMPYDATLLIEGVIMLCCPLPLHQTLGGNSRATAVHVLSSMGAQIWRIFPHAAVVIYILLHWLKAFCFTTKAIQAWVVLGDVLLISTSFLLEAGGSVGLL